MVDPGPGPAEIRHPDFPLLARIRGHERGLLGAAVGFQLLVLVAMVVGNTVPWHGRPTVLLRVVPVDPRDLMRGDYVILGYDISRFPPGSVLGSWAPQDPPETTGREVYVELLPEADGRHHAGGAVSVERPASGKFIRGRIAGRGQIVFGIESFFVQEGKGKEYEDAIRRHKLSAEVALAADGRAALRRLVVE